MANNIDDLVQQLSNKLGDDAEAATLIAVLVAAWAGMAARLEYSERIRNVAGGMAAQSVQKVGESMDRLNQDVQAQGAELAKLHSDIESVMTSAGQSAAAADRAMQDVLTVYDRFGGNVDQLKVGVASLAKSVIASTVPGAGAALGPRVDRLLGL